MFRFAALEFNFTLTARWGTLHTSPFYRKTIEIIPFFAAIANRTGGESTILYHLEISRKAVGVLIATVTKEIQKKKFSNAFYTTFADNASESHGMSNIIVNSEVTSQFSIDE